MALLSVFARLVRSLARRAGLGSARFPEAALLVVAIAALANAETAGMPILPQEDLGRWFAALYAGTAASVLARLALEAHGAGRAALAAASVLAAAVFGTAIFFSQRLGLFAPVLVAALTLAVPLAPYTARPDDRRFWTFTLWTTVGVALAFVSVLLFVLGVSAILEMIRFLLEVGLGSSAYEHIYVTALMLVGPLIALGRIPTDFDEIAPVVEEDRMAQGVRFLFDWVAAPLLLVTAVVLHLYAAKILLAGALPKNEVGWIVTLYTVLVLSMRIAVEPFVTGGGGATRAFARVWAPMLAVPLGLLLFAIVQRVAPEGWTVERYYLALGAFAAVLVLALQLIPACRGKIRAIAAIPLALLALSSFGPWGAFDTVGRSQAARLSDILAERGENGTLDDARAVAIRSRIGALAEAGELARALALVPEDRRAAVAEAVAGGVSDAESRMIAALGADVPVVPSPARRMFAAGRDTLLDAGGYDRVLMERAIVASGFATGQPLGGVLTSLDGADLVLGWNGRTDRFPLTAAIEAIPAGAYDTDPAGVEPVVAEVASPSGRTIRLRIRGLTIDAETRLPSELDATLLLRAADWPAP